METRSYTARFKVGDIIKVCQPDYETVNGTAHPFEGRTGKVLSVIFPGDILYENAGIPNGTGEVKYRVELNVPGQYNRYLLSEKELVRA